MRGKEHHTYLTPGYLRQCFVFRISNILLLYLLFFFDVFYRTFLDVFLFGDKNKIANVLPLKKWKNRFKTAILVLILLLLFDIIFHLSSAPYRNIKHKFKHLVQCFSTFYGPRHPLTLKKFWRHPYVVKTITWGTLICKSPQV